MQNQSKREITFYTQLKTALRECGIAVRSINIFCFSGFNHESHTTINKRGVMFPSLSGMKFAPVA